MARRAKLDDAAKARVLALDAQGYGPAAIARELGDVSERTVGRVLSESRDQATVARVTTTVAEAIAGEPIERQVARLAELRSIIATVAKRAQIDPAAARVYGTLLRSESELERSIHQLTPRADAELAGLRVLAESERLRAVEEAAAYAADYHAARR